MQKISYSAVQVEDPMADIYGHIGLGHQPARQVGGQRGQERPKASGKQEKLNKMKADKIIPKPRRFDIWHLHEKGLGL